MNDVLGGERFVSAEPIEKGMMKQAQDVLRQYDNMQDPAPTWYLKEKQIYILNPCRFLSTAYWKKAYFPVPEVPETMRIIHGVDLDIDASDAKRYFRLIHYPQTQYDASLSDDYEYRKYSEVVIFWSGDESTWEVVYK